MHSDVQPINTNVARNKEEDGSASDGSLGKNTVNCKTQRLARSVEKGIPKHKRQSRLVNAKPDFVGFAYNE